MNAVFAAATALFVIFGGPRAEGTLDELVARHETECTGERPGAECGAIAAELEVLLYGELRALYRMGAEVDRETLRTAAAAEFPHLALLALRWMGEKRAEGDDAAFVAALGNRSAAVRTAALRLLEGRVPPEVRALDAFLVTSSRGQDQDLVPDPDPDADRLEFAPYPGARLVRLASGRDRAFFTTPDAPDKVVATIGKGKKVLDVEALSERMNAAVESQMEAMNAVMEKLAAETDPAKIEAEMKKLEASQEPEGDPLAGLGLAIGRLDARFVILREKPPSKPGSPPKIVRAAAVFRDDALRATVILVPLP